MTAYYIINIYTLKESEVKNQWLFSNPIKKLGCQNRLMAMVDVFGGYQTKFSHAMKKHYYIKFYEYGEYRSFNIKNWIFPKEIKGLVYSSRSGNTHNEFSFECFSPSGLKYYINVHIREPYIWGVLEIFKILVESPETRFIKYGYDGKGTFRISFRSYDTPNGKYFPFDIKDYIR